MHADAAAGGDEGVAVMQRVCEVGQAGVGSRTRRVDFGRTLHGERLVWPFGIEFLNKVVEAGLLLQTVHSGRSGCFFLQRQMHALVAAVLLWVARLDALDGDAEPQPPHREFGEIKEAVRTSERHAIVGPDRLGQATLLEELLEGSDSKVLAGRFKGFAEQQKARGVVGDSQRKAVPAIAELELALEIGAPEVVWRGAGRQRRAGRPVPRPSRDLDQAVPVENGVDRALGRNADVAVQSADQDLADLAGTPMGLVALGRDDQALDLPRQLVGVANRPARTVGQGLEAVFLVALEDLVAGLARNAERATDLAHRFAVQQLSDEPQALVHHRTLLPRHPHLPRKGRKGERCYPCVRYDLSPMSRAAQRFIEKANSPLSGGKACDCHPTLLTTPKRVRLRG